eukprot:scaffold2971_cov274-Pinguiococcus_pyrenoidosus.AAC.7
MGASHPTSAGETYILQDEGVEVGSRDGLGMHAVSVCFFQGAMLVRVVQDIPLLHVPPLEDLL